MSENKETEQPPKESTCSRFGVERIVMPDLETKLWHYVFGMVLSICTLGTFFVWYYGAMFSRKTYWNRKALYDYLEENELPEPTTCCSFTTWDIGGLQVTKYGDAWYAYDGEDLKICSFIGGINDQKRYDSIFMMLGT